MQDEILKSIAKAIHLEFGEELSIYTDSVSQGLATPSFFIYVSQNIKKRMLGKRYFNKTQFTVEYICDELASKNLNILEVANRLHFLLEFIDVNGDLIEGSNLHYDTKGGVLKFFVNYNTFFYVEKEESELMEKIESQTAITD